MLLTNTHILFHEFNYLEPATLSEATALLAEFGADARVMAGGTDLLVQMKMERRQPPNVIALNKIRELGSVISRAASDRVHQQNLNPTERDSSSPNTLLGMTGSEVDIGATTSIRSIYKSPIIIHSYTALVEACNWFSTVQIMYMATLGGNLCNASPAADSAPPLLVFDATMTLQADSGERVVPLDEFFLAPGKTVLREDELLTRVVLPPPALRTGSAFLKISRVAADISQVCAAVRVTRDGNLVRDARIALGSVAPTPLRARDAERALVGQPFSAELAERIGEIAAQEIKPIGDVRASREYRQSVARVIVRDALLKAWERAGDEREAFA